MVDKDRDVISIETISLNNNIGVDPDIKVSENVQAGSCLRTLAIFVLAIIGFYGLLGYVITHEVENEGEAYCRV